MKILLAMTSLALLLALTNCDKKKDDAAATDATSQEATTSDTSADTSSDAATAESTEESK